MEDFLRKYQKCIDNTFQKYAEKTAICYMHENESDTAFSFEAIYRAITSFGNILKTHGLFQGDRVAIVSPHSPFSIVAGISLAYWNLTSVLIDDSLPSSEISRLLKKSDVRAILTVPKRFYNLSPFDYEGIPVLELGTDEFSYPLFRGCCEQPLLSETPDPDSEVIAILYSSGTTSEMKGIMTTYTSVLLAKDIFIDLSGLTPEMSYLLVLPFNHIAGFTGAMTYLLTGCTLGMLENATALGLQKGLQRFKPSYFAMVPKVFEVMEQKIRQSIHEKGVLVEAGLNFALKTSGVLRKYFGCKIGRRMFHPILSTVLGENIFGIGTGASPCKPETAEFYLNMGVEWANLYATTETSVPITATGIHDCYPVGTVGNIYGHNGISVKIHNPDKDGIGEIYVKSVLMMKGYFRDIEATKNAFDDGYFKTGDSGYIDKRGYLYVTGRIKESILLSTGKKVSPTDLDQMYQAYCPRECTVASCGIPVAGTGYDEIHLFIEAPNFSPNEQADLEQKLLSLSRTGSAIYPVKGVHFIPKLPTTTVGKVKRFILREMVGEESAAASTRQTISEQASATGSVRETVIDALSKLSDSIPHEYVDSLRLKEDLGLNSLAMFELCADIETRLNIQIVNQLGSIATLGDLVELASCIYGGGNSAAPSTPHVPDYPAKKTNGDEVALHTALWVFSHLWKLKSYGSQNLPKNQNYILCANHINNLDGFWIFYAMGEHFHSEKFAYLAAEHRNRGTVSRKLFRMLGCIPIDRFGNPAPGIRCAQKWLQLGNSLLIHPEGARSRNGNMLPLKEGAAELAISANIPIVPVQISGAYDIFPRHKKIPKLFDWRHCRRYSLKISFGVPISPAGKNASELTEMTKNAIERL